MNLGKKTLFFCAWLKDVWCRPVQKDKPIQVLELIAKKKIFIQTSNELGFPIKPTYIQNTFLTIKLLLTRV